MTKMLIWKEAKAQELNLRLGPVLVPYAAAAGMMDCSVLTQGSVSC